MKKLFASVFIVIVTLFTINSYAEKLRIRDCFAAMPDSILPYLTKNNRLDCIDFAENNMKTPVENRFGEKTHMEELTDSFLLLQLNKQTTLQMKLLKTTTGDTLICMVKTMKTPEPISEISFYRPNWSVVDVAIPDTMAEDTNASYLTSYELSRENDSLTIIKNKIFLNDKELKDKKPLIKVYPLLSPKILSK